MAWGWRSANREIDRLRRLDQPVPWRSKLCRKWNFRQCAVRVPERAVRVPERGRSGEDPVHRSARIRELSTDAARALIRRLGLVGWGVVGGVGLEPVAACRPIYVDGPGRRWNAGRGLTETCHRQETAVSNASMPPPARRPRRRRYRACRTGTVWPPARPGRRRRARVVAGVLVLALVVAAVVVLRVVLR